MHLEGCAFLKTRLPNGEDTSLEFKYMYSVSAIRASGYVEKTRYYHDSFGVFICLLTNCQSFSDQTEEFLVSDVSCSVILWSPVV